MKTFISVIVILFLIIISFSLYVYLKVPNLEPKVSIVDVYSSNFWQKVYIKRKVWGITGNHEFTVVSKSGDESFEPNEDNEYVYKGLSPIFYSFRDDTLNIYVMKESKKPTEMTTRIQVNQIVLTNPQMMNLMVNYKDKGLKKVE